MMLPEKPVVEVKSIDFMDKVEAPGAPLACKVKISAGEWTPPGPPYGHKKTHILVLFGKSTANGFEYYTFEREGEEYVYSCLKLSYGIMELQERTLSMYSYAPVLDRSTTLDARVVAISGDLSLDPYYCVREVGGSRHVIGVQRSTIEEWLRSKEIIYGDAVFEGVCTVTPPGTPPGTPPAVGKPSLIESLFPRLFGNFAPRISCLSTAETISELALCLFPRLEAMLSPPEVPPAPPEVPPEAPPVLPDVNVRSLIMEPLEDELSSCSLIRLRANFRNNNLYRGEYMYFVVIPGRVAEGGFEAYGFDYGGDTWVYCMINASDAPERGKDGLSGWTQHYLVPLSDEELEVDAQVVTISADEYHRNVPDADKFRVDWGQGPYVIAIRKQAYDRLLANYDIFGVDIIGRAYRVLPRVKECPLEPVQR